MPRSSTESFRLISGQDKPVLKPTPSAMDVGPLDPDKFMKEAHTQRRIMQGKPLMYPVPDPAGMMRVPTYRMALVKNYEELPRSFRRNAMGMFAIGASEPEVQSKFGIAKKSWEEWVTLYPEFAEFVSVGLNRAQAWWELQARNYVSESSSKFNAALWFMNMKNRFGYKDQKELKIEERSLIGHVLLPPEALDPHTMLSLKNPDAED